MTTKKTPETTEQAAKPENNDCFIIMPIADHSDYKAGHFKRVYEDIFAPACRAAGYRPVRADDVAQTNLIHLDILQKLLESPMAICDLSTRNPNVLFELGLRQAFDKPTILVQEVGTPQIFDINLFRYTQYRNGLDYRDVLADQKSIQKVLEETKQAVVEGKSINSIIRLLSIMNPASLQDSSKFEEKEYFQILMAELKGVKNTINTLNNSANSTKKSEKIDYLHADTIISLGLKANNNEDFGVMKEFTFECQKINGIMNFDANIGLFSTNITAQCQLRNLSKIEDEIRVLAIHSGILIEEFNYET